jgi:hypothetical protein
MITKLSMIVQQRIGFGTARQFLHTADRMMAFRSARIGCNSSQCSRRVPLAVSCGLLSRQLRRARPLRENDTVERDIAQLTGHFEHENPSKRCCSRPPGLLKPARNQRFIDRSDFKPVYKSESLNHLFGSLID